MITWNKEMIKWPYITKRKYKTTARSHEKKRRSRKARVSHSSLNYKSSLLFVKNSKIKSRLMITTCGKTFVFCTHFAKDVNVIKS